MRVTIKAKLLASFGSLLLLTGIAGYAGVSSLSQSNASMEALAAHPLEQLRQIKALDTDVMATRRQLLALLVYQDAASQAAIQKDLAKTWTSIDRDIQEFVAALPPERKGEIANLMPLMASYREILDRSLALILAQDKTPVVTSLARTAGDFEALSKRLDALQAQYPASPVPSELARAAGAARLATAAAFASADPALRKEASQDLARAESAFTAKLATLRDLPGLAPDALTGIETSAGSLFLTGRGIAQDGV